MSREKVRPEDTSFDGADLAESTDHLRGLLQLFF